MAAGTWRIVSASLRVRGSSANYVLDTEVDGYDPRVKLIPVPSSNYLSWTQDLDSSEAALDQMYAFTLEFLDDHDFNHTEVILLESAAKSYEAVTSNVLETPRTNTAGTPIDFQQIAGSGSLPWDRITISRVKYSDNVAGQVDYVVTAVLERIQ